MKLPDITDPDFMAAYGAALNNTQREVISKDSIKSGTLESLIVKWQLSEEFSLLKESTKAVYNRLLNRIREDPIGQGPFALMEPRHIRLAINALGDAPTTRVRIKRLLSQLMQFAINNGWRDDDPTTSMKVRRQKSEGIHAWTDREIDKS